MTKALPHRVRIEQDIGTQNAIGEPIPAWTVYAVVWANVLSLQGRELFDAQKIAAEVTSSIDMNYNAGVVPKMRVLWSGRTFDIRAVLDETNSKEYLKLLCRELT